MRANRPQLFIGRLKELNLLKEISAKGEAAILVVHGRRRVGKTSLIEHAFSKRGLIKIEGLEDAANSTAKQLYSAVQQLAKFFPGQAITSWRPKTWGDFFRLLAPLIRSGTWTVFLEEFQWLSGYRNQLTSELKLAWDNEFRQNSKLLIVLCGSSPSFMVGNVLRSKALHNRAMQELKVTPLPFSDARKLLSPEISTKEACDAYLLVGGIPEYLKRLSSKSSIYTAFCAAAFSSTGFFVDELNRITVSSLAENPLYLQVLKFLGSHRFSTRLLLAKHLGVKPGGTLSRLLADLEASGFIASYSPIDKAEDSILERYQLSDPFLRVYFRQIRPKLKAILRGEFANETVRGMGVEELSTILGLEFEAFCRAQSATIAHRLSFGSVKYSAGAYFSRVLERQNKGFQLDLVFQRADQVHTICEIKYTREAVGKEIVPAFERALALYKTQFPKVSIHRVLITANGATPELKRAAVFDNIIELAELLETAEKLSTEPLG